MSIPPLSHTGETTGFNVPAGDIYVQVETRELEAMFGAFGPAKIALAASRAARRVRDWLLTQLTRELSTRAQLPQKGIRGRFRRGRHEKNGQFYSNEGYAILWIGLNPVMADASGLKPRHVRRVRGGKYHRGPKPVPGAGVRIGKHFFDRAFIADIYGGAKVYRRKNLGSESEKLPVVRMSIPINETMQEILPKYQAAAARMFSQRLEHEVNFLLEKAA